MDNIAFIGRDVYNWKTSTREPAPVALEVTVFRSAPQRRLLLALTAVLALTLGLGACSSDDSEDAGSSSTTAAPADGGATAETVRLGYFPNVTHAPALVGVAEGTFTKALGDTTLETKTFNAGPEAVEALFAEALDISYIGPNPAINAFQQSNGEAIRIISGSTSGGAYFVVQPEVDDAADLKGTDRGVPAARRHPGRGLAGLAEGRRAEHRLLRRR